jgi:ATP-dependent RNA helicase DeaD
LTDKTDHQFPEAFAALGVRPSILRALGEEKFIIPSVIQNMLIPKALAGYDILGQARTGTGKTAAFGIPILQQCQREGATQALILVPTRELAMQVDTEIKRIAKYTPIRTVPVYGGQKITAQMKFLKHHPQVVVGTPGRVIDLLDRRIINLNNIRFIVLDEVDRMLDIGFRDDIRNILSRVRGTGNRAGAPADNRQPDTQGQQGEDNRAAFGKTHQTMFVSATIAGEIERLARTYMREPIEKLIAPGADEKPTVAEVEQYYLSVQPWDKYRLLRALLEQENPDLAIVFTKTKHGAQKLAKKLHADGIECREIHGNLAQNKRDRVMKSFRGGKFDVLVATDLASRGIDVADISHIINFDIPEDPEVYVHRVGRTARMGAKGKAFTLVTRQQGEELTRVEELINMIVPQATVEGFEPRPVPSDWAEHPPGHGPPQHQQPEPVRSGPPIASKHPPDEQPVTLKPRPLTIGSKIPLSRRHKRRR